MKHIVMFSGGVGSWMTAKRVAERYGTKDLVLCFADTKMEHATLYTFLEQAAGNVGGELVYLQEGRDPWGVFFDVRFLGNSRIDPCSRILKREIIRKWLDDNFDPTDTVVYLGLDWTEGHRFDRAKGFWHPWTVAAPLLNPPLLEKVEMLALLEAEGISVPELYTKGFPHNNCGGFCIKAGMAHFRLLLMEYPETYGYHERKEQELREYLDKDIAILRDRRGGAVTPLTLKKFRERMEQDNSQCDLFDWGGCGCFSP